MLKASVLSLILLAGLPAFAQSHAFVYLAPGGEFDRFHGNTTTDATAHFGVGGEYVMKNGIGFGADVGVLGVIFGDTFAAFSLDGTYHFRRQRLVDPFVSAGYSVFFDTGSTGFFGNSSTVGHLSLFNFGGGMNLWFSRHVGAKIQFRDHIHWHNGETNNFPEVMLGLGFH